MKLNLDPPPDFRGLDPDKPIEVYSRHLPHWRQQGATYFVTFNLADVLPQSKQDELASMRREWQHQNPPPRSEAAWTEFAKEVFRLSERWMDAGHGACWFRKEQYAEELQRAVLHYHDQQYEIGCLAVMANHCHLTIRPFDGYKLEDVIGGIKRASSRFITKIEGLTDELWQQESYDRIVRDLEHLYRVVQYIGNNPRRAGLPVIEWRRWINPRWQAVGWDFFDQ